jgi:hypothetical protein
MIIRRYGGSMHSVELNFDSKALNEIGFRRDQRWSAPAEEFERDWERIEAHELAARSEGNVQDHTEQALLDELEARLHEIEAGLDEGDVVVVESQTGADYPKTRHSTRTVVVEGENRLRFTGWVEPPLRVARYRRRG